MELSWTGGGRKREREEERGEGEMMGRDHVGGDTFNFVLWKPPRPLAG